MEKELWKQEKEEILERYELSMERIRTMHKEASVAAPFYDYFQKMASFIEKMDELAQAAGICRYSFGGASETEQGAL